MKIEYPYLPKGRKILYVSERNIYMRLAKTVAERSGCVKQATGAVIIRDNTILGYGTNAGRKVGACPRDKAGYKTGEGYHLCREECAQEGHAEVTAIRNARKVRGCDNLTGADLYLYGHWWCCQPCWDAMIAAGIRHVYLLHGSHELFNPEINRKNG